MKEAEEKTTLNSYHIERNRLACLEVEKMMKHPSTLEEMREQTRKIMDGQRPYCLINEDNSINTIEYNSIFSEIENSNMAEELNEIAAKYNLNLIEKKYPRLGINISVEEILELKESKVLTVDVDNNLTINQESLNPIAKLLYSLVWKQGDLQKLKAIIEGIEEVDNPSNDKENALVFYCYGNHLGNPSKFPIIDQHVVRAFNLFKDYSNRDSIRKSDKVDQKDRQNFLNWHSNKFENKSSDFLYYLDRLLFEIGKTVKINRKFNNKIK